MNGKESFGATRIYRQARDLLLRHREDYASACAEFRWPELLDFNWALDHFDDLAGGNSRTALWIVDEPGAEVKRSFEELRTASDRAANFLDKLGVRRGDRVLVMLPNRVELWKIMLAAIKLGAVLSPATMLLSESDLQDRIERGRMRAVIVDAASTSKFESIADGCMLGNPPGQPVRYGSMGRPLPGHHIELLDLDGKPAIEGEISVRLTPPPRQSHGRVCRR